MGKKTSIGHLLPVLFGFFIMGFCDIVGVATSYVQKQFSLSESLAGLIPSMVFLWFLLLSVPVACAMNRAGRRRMVIIGNAVTITGMLIPLVCKGFGGYLTAFALLGIGNTILQVSLNPLLTNVVDGKALSSSLTAGQVIKAVSSFSGPFIAIFAASVLGSWDMMFPIFAATALMSAIWLAMTPIKEKEASGISSPLQVFSVLKDKKILFLFLGIVAVVGVDVGINTLAPKLLMERCGLPVEEAGLGSSVYFLCRVMGAFLGTVLLAKFSDRTYSIIHIISGIAALAVLLVMKGSYPILVLLGVAGYSFSSIFSVIYSQALKHKPDLANEISGLMITGVFGGAIVPPLMGVLADAAGSQAGSLSVLIVFAAYLLVCSLSFKTKKEA